MGYLGKDRSKTGFGLQFDFIIVHESAHEWFGNSITASDVAYNWIHEGWTTYAEALFAECLLDKESANAYALGTWEMIQNEQNVQAEKGVHKEGGDIYTK
jgi:aminopeptidase N